MSDSISAKDMGDTVETITTETEKAIAPGVFTRLGRTIANNKVKTAATVVIAAGVGYLTYVRLRNNGTLDDVVDTVEAATSSTASLWR